MCNMENLNREAFSTLRDIWEQSEFKANVFLLIMPAQVDYVDLQADCSQRIL